MGLQLSGGVLLRLAGTAALQLLLQLVCVLLLIAGPSANSISRGE